jgi:hypothetical protein
MIEIKRLAAMLVATLATRLGATLGLEFFSSATTRLQTPSLDSGSMPRRWQKI